MNFIETILTEIELSDCAPDASLARSIEIDGLIVPIILSFISDDTGYIDPHATVKYRIIDGKRRVATLRDMGKLYVNAELRNIGSASQARVTLAANIARSRNIAAEAQAIQAIIQDDPLAAADIDHLCAITGIRKVVIKELLALYSGLDKICFDLLGKGLLKPTLAKKLIRLPKAVQRGLAISLPLTGKTVDAALRDQRVEQLTIIDDIEVPTLTQSSYVAQSIDAFAVRMSGSERQILMQAAEIVRRYEVEGLD
jgi:hypothetical protein